MVTVYKPTVNSYRETLTPLNVNRTRRDHFLVRSIFDRYIECIQPRKQLNKRFVLIGSYFWI